MERKTYDIPEIEERLQAAVNALTPDILDKINLDEIPQDKKLVKASVDSDRIIKLYRRARNAAIAMAACLTVMVVGGGVTYYQNNKIDSLIGIDVNPSIELSVNRKDKVLKAAALNDDAANIIAGMDLKNVDLDIAVNALVGSMVRNGYLDEIDNAILVTVTNDSKEKADTLRYTVVNDFETSLEAHNVHAVVYDQQSPESNELKALADKLGISMGKAYFLSELVKENNLSESDMVRFADMTMGEIAGEIAAESYTVRNDRTNESAAVGAVPETTAAPTEPATEAVPEETSAPAEESEASSEAETKPSEESGSASGSDKSDLQSESAGAIVPVEETEAPQEISTVSKVRIDYVDYYEDIVSVYFKTKVKWKNPTVSVHDSYGEAYAATIEGTGSDFCEIKVSGLPGGDSATFDIAGVAGREDETFASIHGYFTAPDIAEGLEEGDNSYNYTDSEDDEKTASDAADSDTTVSDTADSNTTDSNTTDSNTTDSNIESSNTEDSNTEHSNTEDSDVTASDVADSDI